MTKVAVAPVQAIHVMGALIVSTRPTHAQCIYTYIHPTTKRRFDILRRHRPFDFYDGQDRKDGVLNAPCFFVEEFRPIGTVIEYDDQGKPLRALREPLIAEGEKQFGPNGLHAFLLEKGINPACVPLLGSAQDEREIYYPDFESAATAIAAAVTNNYRHQHRRIKS